MKIYFKYRMTNKSSSGHNGRHGMNNINQRRPKSYLRKRRNKYNNKNGQLNRITAILEKFFSVPAYQ